MGNTQAVRPQYRRREFIFLFYFVLGFIGVRVWILIADTGNENLEIIGGVITFILAVFFYLQYLKYARARSALQVNSALIHGDLHLLNLHLLILHRESVNRAQLQEPAGLSQQMIDSLETFVFDGSITNKPSFLLSEDVKMSNGNMDVKQDSDLESSLPVSTVAHTLSEQQFKVTNFDSTCSICLAEYTNGEVLSRLPCGHVYHTGCVNQWLQLHVSCPLCKQNIQQLLGVPSDLRRESVSVAQNNSVINISNTNGRDTAAGGSIINPLSAAATDVESPNVNESTTQPQSAHPVEEQKESR